jgi:hypothetical protein
MLYHTTAYNTTIVYYISKYANAYMMCMLLVLVQYTCMIINNINMRIYLTSTTAKN